jgi:hypothetical protein
MANPPFRNIQIKMHRKVSLIIRCNIGSYRPLVLKVSKIVKNKHMIDQVYDKIRNLTGPVTYQSNSNSPASEVSRGVY